MDNKSDSAQASRADQFWRGLTLLQLKQPWLWIVAAWVIGAVAAPWVMKLGLNSGWTALLPKDRISVRDLEATEKRMVGLSTLSVVVVAKDLKAKQDFIRDLAPKLEHLESLGVKRVDWNVSGYQTFIDKHKYLYAPLEDLEDVRDRLDNYLNYQKAKANPLFVDLIDEEDTETPESILKDVEEKEKKDNQSERYPGGYYVHPTGYMAVLFVRTDLPNGDAVAINRLLGAIQHVVKSLNPKRYAPDLHIEFAGDVIGAREEHEAIARELVIASILTSIAVLLAIYVFFGHLRALFLLGFSIIVPLLVTFAIAKLIVTDLNTSTAFLGSIVLGNGINPMIIWLARFFEERRKSDNIEHVIERTHRAVWASTLTASLAAAFAYGSLIITDFRGFKDFGYIGGVGMLICWLGSVLILPAAAILFERFRPMRAATGRIDDNLYGRILWKMVTRHPRNAWIASAILGVIGLGLTGYALAHDPLEYDFRKLRSVREQTSRASHLNSQINDIVGKGASNMGVVMLTPDLESARWLANHLREGAKRGALWGKVTTIDDLLPADQDTKVEILADIRRILLDMKKYADESQLKTIDEHLPDEHVETLTVAMLPEQVARLYTERDGSRGRILFVEESKGHSQWDGRYLVSWASALRAIHLPNGKRPPLIGRAPIFADMISTIRHDAPIVMMASLCIIVVLLVTSFRQKRHMVYALVSLLLGVVWMTGVMTVLGVRLNFLNFVAIPITFGIGVDYSVNLVRRFADERELGRTVREALKLAVTDTGGAVTLCSLTTIIGYISLYTSANQALNSFGLAMTISELTCLGAATMGVSAWLLWRSERKGPPVAVAVNPPTPTANVMPERKSAPEAQPHS